MMTNRYVSIDGHQRLMPTHITPPAEIANENRRENRFVESVAVQKDTASDDRPTDQIYTIGYRQADHQLITGVFVERWAFAEYPSDGDVEQKTYEGRDKYD